MMGPRAMMGYGGPGSWMMGSGGFSQAMCNVMANHIEGRLAYIKAELKITEPQGSLWNGYAVAARDNANAMRAHCTTMMNKCSANLPDRLDQHEQLMAAQLDAVRAMNKSLKPLMPRLATIKRKLPTNSFGDPWA